MARDFAADAKQSSSLERTTNEVYSQNQTFHIRQGHSSGFGVREGDYLNQGLPGNQYSQSKIYNPQKSRKSQKYPSNVAAMQQQISLQNATAQMGKQRSGQSLGGALSIQKS